MEIGDDTSSNATKIDSCNDECFQSPFGDDSSSRKYESSDGEYPHSI
jgi:hypothetical protein